MLHKYVIKIWSITVKNNSQFSPASDTIIKSISLMEEFMKLITLDPWAILHAVPGENKLCVSLYRVIVSSLQGRQNFMVNFWPRNTGPNLSMCYS